MLLRDVQVTILQTYSRVTTLQRYSGDKAADLHFGDIITDIHWCDKVNNIYTGDNTSNSHSYDNVSDIQFSKLSWMTFIDFFHVKQKQITIKIFKYTRQTCQVA